MAVTRTLAAGSPELFQQLERLTKSHSLRGSESLRKLLEYLARQSVEHPDAPLKEYQIATEVYGRQANFDPQSDSTIRVQAGRLRMKLAEYYAAEGANDPIVVTIPKGSYHLVFESKQAPLALEAILPTSETAAPVENNGTVSARRRLAVGIFVACLIVAVTVLASLLWVHKRVTVAGTSTAAGPVVNGPLAEFWRPFASAREEPWVIFSNAAFVGRPETGMRYLKSNEDAPPRVYDHYTGVGEVLAVHALDEVFNSLGRKLRVKRGSLFSLDDANNTDLIFVGSPSENLSLHDIPGTQEFMFERVASGARKGDLAVVNRHPKAGESASYLASPSSASLTEDYGVIAMLPGVSPERFMMIVAGTTTFGTQGSVEFVCRPDSVQKLMHEIPGSTTAMRPFEALVRVKIARGVPLDTELIAVRPR
jgi:hypothetical protein